MMVPVSVGAERQVGGCTCLCVGGEWDSARWCDTG